MTQLVLIAAMAYERVIGCNNAIPWHLPEDLKHFKATTLGKPVLMGRKTFESIGQKPLPNRRNVVVTHQTTLLAQDIEVVHSVPEGLALLKTEPIVYVVGGAAIYFATLPLANEIYLTKIELKVKGDTFFPAFDTQKTWREMTRTTHQSSQGLVYHFVRYVR